MCGIGGTCTLGVVGGLRKRLRQCKIYRDYQLDTVISDLQYEAITGAIRILKNHQESRGDAVISKADGGNGV